jgi:hypothetical protein
MRIIVLNAYAHILLFLIPVSLFSQVPGPVGIENETPLVLRCGVVVSSIPCGTTPDFGIPIVIHEFDLLVNVTYTDITCPGIYPKEYSVTRIWKATDNCGNMDVCSRTIFVEDTVAPLITSPAEVIPIECSIPLHFGSTAVVDECDDEAMNMFSEVQVKPCFTVMNTNQLKCVFVNKCGSYLFRGGARIKHDDVE